MIQKPFCLNGKYPARLALLCDKKGSCSKGKTQRIIYSSSSTPPF
jgi:hypothetical protein